MKFSFTKRKKNIKRSAPVYRATVTKMHASFNVNISITVCVYTFTRILAVQVFNNQNKMPRTFLHNKQPLLNLMHCQMSESFQTTITFCLLYTCTLSFPQQWSDNTEYLNKSLYSTEFSNLVSKTVEKRN